ncbi:DUF899-domain-containing protein [Hyaloscypha variabilis F]|uniref:DUF899-domain-containing protein n=1 Tax=Hyaloscypha variabilis (strain UAMH 11265 / GT02V1 / F) TaxID=1149755 RepID=A0A2J6SDS1_HYAVF|nr:DUF899-domain-containing protein [Hyaloscypha variabilis F]
MPSKQVVSETEWTKARKALLIKEKAHTRANDALTAELRSLPMVKIEKEYTFDGPNGKVTLADLFDGRKQLIVHHFMFGPENEVGCEGCSFMADNMPSHPSHLKARETTMVMVSRAPLAKIQAFQKRMGWKYPWYSSFGTDFNYDFHVTNDEAVAPVQYNYKDKEEILQLSNAGNRLAIKGEAPGLSVFLSEDGEVFHTYSSYARGHDALLVTNKLLDLTPLGRQDGVELKYHDEY